MLRIALTGGIACGKSSVGIFLSMDNVEICEADELSHGLMVRNSPLFKEIVKGFGNGIIGVDGNIDRKILGDRIFSSPYEREKLNALVHPGVRSAWQNWLDNRDEKCLVAVVIVPLLYEAGMAKGWDTVICVGSSRSMQFRRLINRGLSEEKAKKCMAAQMSVNRKMGLADYVIVNNGTEDMLRKQTMRVWQNILEDKNGGK